MPVSCPTLYRSTVEAFLSETEWEVSLPKPRKTMNQALHYFNANVFASELDKPGDPPILKNLAFRPAHFDIEQLVEMPVIVQLRQTVSQ